MSDNIASPEDETQQNELPQDQPQQSIPKSFDANEPHADAPPTSPIMPFVDTWKTSVGYSVLGACVAWPMMVVLFLVGFFLSIGFAWALGFVLGMDSDAVNALAYVFIPGLALIIKDTFSLIYMLKIYPSLFSEKPKLKSSRIVSFLNFIFGGIIFGALWNRNLTKKEKGISQTVFAVLTALLLAGTIVSIGAGIFQVTTYNSQGTVNTEKPHAASPAYDNQGTVNTENISFMYPKEWMLFTDEDLSEAEAKDFSEYTILGQSVKSFAAVGPKDNTDINFAVYNFANFEYSYEDLKEEWLKMPAESLGTDTYEIITIDGCEAIKGTTMSNDSFIVTFILPNIDGKITSTFLAAYPQEYTQSLAVIDSVTIHENKGKLASQN